ncbi:hypothetical protein U1Q18_033339 [Sarracenia purpurea var. burkii]
MEAPHRIIAQALPKLPRPTLRSRLGYAKISKSLDFRFCASDLRSKKTTAPPLPETPLPELFAPMSSLTVAPAIPMEICIGPANLRTQKSPSEYLVVAQLVAPPQIYRQRRKPCNSGGLYAFLKIGINRSPK